MKTQTKVLDLQRLLARIEMEEKELAARQAAQRELDNLIKGDGIPLMDPSTTAMAKQARINADNARQAFKALPSLRRGLAENVHKASMELALNAARRMGGIYSGDTSHHVSFRDKADAFTLTESGEQYSRSCKYSKTDATHYVRLDPSRVYCLVETELLRRMSSSDGLPLIALDEDGKATWVASNGKQIKAVNGWIIGDELCCYHSTKSREDAVKGHARKRAEIDRRNVEAAERQRAWKSSPEYKAERRARLVARLCKEAQATVEDARAIGYCMPGIEAFQQQHGIGNTASLPQLVRTGNPSAVALAMRLARKIVKTAAA